LYYLLPRISRWIFKPTNNLTHARMNASFHYNTSNELFAAFLSSDMSYSSALWSGDTHESLESAQQRKIHNILERARISSSDHVLDVGCGWGHLAIEAVRTTGCQVTGLTLSSEQKILAEKRIKVAGLEDRITIILCDYRKAPRPKGGYDRIISVEMLEHVGDKYMNGYFQSMSELLKPVGGIVVVQGITNINLVRMSLLLLLYLVLTVGVPRSMTTCRALTTSSTVMSSREASFRQLTSSSHRSTLELQVHLR
jgi:cyclopropane-fatty-acyl-phospholipid synthase